MSLNGHLRRIYEDEADADIEAFGYFESTFQESSKGNLYTHWDDKTVTVFQRANGMFAWAIATSDDVRYSRKSYESPFEAMVALWHELDG